MIATESAIEGVGEWTEELADSELCEAYGWSWDQLQATPLYIRKAFSQIQIMKNKAQADKMRDTGG